jgi:hypothetical protein
MACGNVTFYQMAANSREGIIRLHFGQLHLFLSLAMTDGSMLTPPPSRLLHKRLDVTPLEVIRGFLAPAVDWTKQIDPNVRRHITSIVLH